LLCVLVVVIAATTLGAAPASQQASASMDDIRKLYDDGRYNDVLRETSRALSMRDEILRSRGFERFELLRLRAESNLRLKQPAPASDTFAAAAKELAATDPDRAAFFRAVSIVVKRSKNNAYVPKRGKSEAIDLLNEDSRKRAIVALYDDEAADVLARVNAMRKADSLPPIVEAASRLKELADLERAAKGSNDETENRLLKLGDDARRIIGASLNKMTDNVEAISRRANERYLIQEGHIYRKRGLQGRDRDNLLDVMSTSEKIPDAISKLSEQLGTEGDFFKKTKDDAAKLYDRARYVMNDDYTGVYAEP